MSSKIDKEYECSLSPDALEKAKETLNEIPDNRLLEVKTLRKRVEKIPGLIPRKDTKFLLAFLRGYFFDQEKAFGLVKNFYQIKQDRDDVFADLKPSRVKHVIETGVLEVLKHRDKDGCRVIVFRSGLWDTDRFSVIDLCATYIIYILKLMEEEETQVNGLHYINNSDGVTMKHIAQLTPSMAKFIVNLGFFHLPLHFRRVDYVNENKLFELAFSVFRPFLDPDVMKKINFNGKNLKALHATMDPDFIPADIGGNEEFMSNKEWYNSILEDDKWYEDQNKQFGFLSMKLENEKKESTREHAGMKGLGGSFKKLEV